MKHPLALAAIAAVAICASSASATDSAETDLSPVSMWEQDKSLILDARDITL